MTTRDERKATREARGEIEREKEWSHASAVAEVAWHRYCVARGVDPKASAKDVELARERAAFVAIIRDSAFVVEHDGLEAAADWLALEQMGGTG